MFKRLAMKEKDSIKEHIIEVTTELIEQSSDGAGGITTRRIAERAGVGLGLINYHFGSKDNLITECVQRIIGRVVAGFRMDREFESDRERLCAWADYVFEFLFQHPVISRISILGDFESYTAGSNSANTQRGFMMALRCDVPQEDKPMLSFILTAAMQAAFLGSGACRELLGYDFAKREDRAAYISRLVSMLFDKTG